MFNTRVVISSLLSALGKCLVFFLFFLFFLSYFMERFGGRYNLKMKRLFLNTLILGHTDARGVAEEQELI